MGQACSCGTGGRRRDRAGSPTEPRPPMPPVSFADENVPPSMVDLVEQATGQAPMPTIPEKVPVELAGPSPEGTAAGGPPAGSGVGTRLGGSGSAFKNAVGGWGIPGFGGGAQAVPKVVAPSPSGHRVSVEDAFPSQAAHSFGRNAMGQTISGAPLTSSAPLSSQTGTIPQYGGVPGSTASPAGIGGPQQQAGRPAAPGRGGAGAQPGRRSGGREQAGAGARAPAQTERARRSGRPRAQY